MINKSVIISALIGTVIGIWVHRIAVAIVVELYGK